MRLKMILPLAAILGFAATACTPMPIPTSDTRVPAAGTPLAAPRTPLLTATLPAKPKVLRINITAHPETLDPQKASAASEIAVLQMAYEGLTRLDEQGRVMPGAAERWEFSSDGKTLTFHLRDGLKRADGRPLTAKDFEFALKRTVDPRVGAQNQSFLDDVRGAEAAYALDPKSKLEDIERLLDGVGVKAIDTQTVAVSFDQATGYWPTIASTLVAWPSDPIKVQTDRSGWWLKPENHNGNGPFRIIEIQEQVIRLAPNPNYWSGRAKLDRVEFYWLSEPTALESYRQGGLDIVRISADSIAQVQSDAVLRPDMRRAPAPRTTYLGFNVKRAPFSDKNVRRAFSQALDREVFVREVLRGLGQPVLTWIPPGIPAHDEAANVPGYDPKGALQTLVDGGYGTADKKKVDCAKLGTIKLSYSNSSRTQVLFQAIAGSLTRIFACPVLLDPIEANAYAVVVRDPKTTPQVFLISWEEEYPHPQNWLFLQACSGVFASRIGYCNRDFDAALATANQELDFDTAVEKYKTAQRIFVGDVAAAFLWNNENAFLIKPYVLGVWDHHSTGDAAWPGQLGPVTSYAIDLTRVGAGYPAQ